MTDKARDLAAAFEAGTIGRRELVKRLAAIGVAGAAAGAILGEAATKAYAADFDMMAHKGTAVKLLLNKHPYADAMIADLDNFKKASGIDVTYDIFPEDVYFDKVTAALSSRSSEYDAFMTGAYQTWQYGPAGWIADLNEYITDPSKTAAAYNWNDVLPGLRASTAWSGKPGDALGGPGAKQWCVPWGFEANNLAYNKRIFDKVGVTVPKNLPELLDTAAKVQKDNGGYGIGVRGSRSWATIHPGFLSGYSNYGAKDFVQENGKLKAAMNSPQAKEFTALWVKMIQDSGPKEWATYTWYRVGQDLGAGQSGMIYDADILGYFQDGDPKNKEKGNLAFAAFAANPKATDVTANVWIWSLAMSNFSKKKDAAWYFMQWATGTDHLMFGARKMDMVNPIRQSVWDDPEFKTKIGQYPGYLEQYKATAPKAQIYFTPQPLFFNLTTDWAAALQRMVANEVPVNEGLDQLAASFDKQLKSSGLG